MGACGSKSDPESKNALAIQQELERQYQEVSGPHNPFLPNRFPKGFMGSSYERFTNSDILVVLKLRDSPPSKPRTKQNPRPLYISHES